MVNGAFLYGRSQYCTVVKEVDPVTEFFPFALAANSCGLRTIFTLLCTHPDHVEIMEDGEYKDIPLKNCKSIGKRKFERK